MDGWGIGICVVGIILYFVTKKKAIFLFISGVGLGMLIAALWTYYLISSALSF